MKTNNLILLTIITVAIVLGILFYQTSIDSQSMNLDMNRQIGTVDTSLGSPMMGSTDAPITIIEFGDYQCPNCKKWFLETKPDIITNYIDTGKVNLIFVDITFLGKDSIPASRATYCAEEQGQYWNYHGFLYSNQLAIDNGWANIDSLKGYAYNLGLDMDLFVSCLDSGNYEIASLHFTHPTEELYDNLHTESKSNSQINQKIEYGLFILKHTDPNVDLDYFDKQTDGIIKILNDVKIVLISGETLNDSVFKLDVISDLLEMSEMQYKFAMDSNDELSKIVNFEDSHVFVMRAENILSTIEDIEPEQKNKLELKLQQTKLNILNRQSLNDVLIDFENIVNDVGVIEKNGLGFKTAIIALGGLGFGEPGIIGDDGFRSQETQNDSIVFGEPFIPSWVKLNAAWWADDLVTNEEFLSGIEYLIEQKILVVSVVQTPIDDTDNKIPSWIKNRTGWWADGMLSDTEFLSGIEYMIERGILVV